MSQNQIKEAGMPLSKCKKGNKFHIRFLIGAVKHKEIVAGNLGKGGKKCYAEILHITYGNYWDLMAHMAPKSNAWWTAIPGFVEKYCVPEILKQHPDLAAADTSTLTEENCEQWLHEQIERFGEYLVISRDSVKYDGYFTGNN